MTREELVELLNAVPPPEWSITKAGALKTRLANGQEMYMENDSSTGLVWQVYLTEPEAILVDTETQTQSTNWHTWQNGALQPLISNVTFANSVFTQLNNDTGGT